jgi:dual specificity protein kinase YAK1
MVETLGAPPAHMLAASMHGRTYFAPQDGGGWRMWSQPEFEERERMAVPMGKRYFKFTALDDIIAHAAFRSSLSEAERGAEQLQRLALLDFLKGVMALDPALRWTPRQVRFWACV